MKTRIFVVCVVIVLFFGIANAGINDGLVAYYPFNGNANDESGNGYNGVVMGATLTADRNGNSNNAYYFDGNAQYIETNSNLPISSFPMTFSCWVYPDINMAAYIFISDDWDQYWGIYYGFLVQLDSTGQIRAQFAAGENTSVTTTLSVDGPISKGKWSFVTVVFNSMTDIRLYANATILQTTTILPTNQGLKFNNYKDRIGLSYDAQNRYSFKGTIDDISIYNRALSEAEIKQLFTSCPAEKVINYTAKASGNTVLTGLRAFRDHFLSKGEYGKSFIRQYYQHSDEGIRLMMEHPEWITLSAGLLEKIQPALLNAADTGALQLDESILQEIMSLMDEVKPYTSPELSQFIDTVQSRLLKRQAMTP
jgi:hypothetical protein